MARRVAIADYEKAARRRLPAAVWEFVSGGAEDDVSRERNREAFARGAFRPRILRDVSGRDASIELFGHRYAGPVGLAPTGSNALVRRRCDALLAEAFAAANQPHIVSGVSSVPIEELARTNPNAWRQGYFPGDAERIDRTCDRVAEAGIRTLVVTADVPVISNRENTERLRGGWPGRLVLKGVLEPEDAVRAADLGLDGVIVSNHGGRQLDYAPASLDALPGVVAAVGDRLTVMMDGGVRRGSHVLMALALGARAVFAGRPFLYAAAVDGGPGVTRMLELFAREILIDLALLGCPEAAALGPQHIRFASPFSLPPTGDMT